MTPDVHVTKCNVMKRDIFCSPASSVDPECSTDAGKNQKQLSLLRGTEIPSHETIKRILTTDWTHAVSVTDTGKQNSVSRAQMF